MRSTKRLVPVVRAVVPAGGAPAVWIEAPELIRFSAMQVHWRDLETEIPDQPLYLIPSWDGGKTYDALRAELLASLPDANGRARVALGCVQAFRIGSHIGPLKRGTFTVWGEQDLRAADPTAVRTELLPRGSDA